MESDNLLCRMSQLEKMRKEMGKRIGAMEKTEGMGTARMDFMMFRSDLSKRKSNRKASIACFKILSKQVSDRQVDASVSQWELPLKRSKLVSL